jgi:hypothetical protein
MNHVVGVSVKPKFLSWNLRSVVSFRSKTSLMRQSSPALLVVGRG